MNDSTPTSRGQPSGQDGDAPAADPPDLDPPDFDPRRCRALLRVLTSIVWVADAEGRFTQPQPSWQAYTGQDWEQHRGHGWLQAVHPEERDEVLACLRRARDEQALFVTAGRLWHAATGQWRHFEGRGVPVHGPDGEVIEWTGTCRDVEDQKQAERTLQEADVRKDEFIAVLAHELRNPLAPIRNAVHILKNRGNTDLQLAWARDIIDRQIAQVTRLLDDLLDATRIRQNKIELKKARVTLDAILDEAIESSRPVLEQHGHHFELHALAGPIYIDADPARLVQVFANLLNNAAKYTDPGGRVSLTLRREGSHAVVAVKDTGIGIAPDMLTRIFDAFTQAEPAQARSQSGLGIGLSLVRKLVTLHGGTVEAHSDGPGRGSEFTVRLPVSAPRSPPEAPPAASAGPGGLRVLVADDNLDAAETLAVLIQLLGHEAFIAVDGQAAIELAEACRPHIGLIDLGMPKLDGFQVAAQLRKSLPDMVLVATTGYADHSDVQRVLQAGFAHHMAKPMDPDRLAGMLGQLAQTLVSAGSHA